MTETTMGLRDRKRIQTRARMEKAAVDLVLKHGMHVATIEAICRDAVEHPVVEELHPLLEELIWLDGADDVRPAFGSGLNIAAFSSGFGDGSYSSYWGLDAEGAPVRLVTSFDVLEEAMVPPRPPKEYPT